MPIRKFLEWTNQVRKTYSMGWYYPMDWDAWLTIKDNVSREAAFIRFAS